MALASLTLIAQNLWYPFLSFVPNLIGAIIALIVFFIAGKVMGLVVREILIRTGVDRYLKKEEHLKFKASSVFDVITRWTLYTIGFMAATQILGISILTEIMLMVVLFIPQLIGAIVVILVSYGIAVYIKDEILAAKTIYADVLGKMIFFLIIYIGIAIALPIIHIRTQVIENLLVVIVGAVGVGMAIAMGLGLKDVVRDMAKDYAKDFQKKRKRRKK
ncbi:MAG: hypothetical protein KAT37_02665 [Candidatus Aenigmarchaeota archaeon]|nr:hypothetical protein [Candidatus Aenigmarchaeota archaeon]